jgi:glucosamine-6-phosphate deaminase
MPRYAMTMGIGSIVRAKKIIMIATGESKAEAVRDMVEGEVRAQIQLPYCAIMGCYGFS